MLSSETLGEGVHIQARWPMLQVSGNAIECGQRAGALYAGLGRQKRGVLHGARHRRSLCAGISYLRLLRVCGYVACGQVGAKRARLKRTECIANQGRCQNKSERGNQNTAIFPLSHSPISHDADCPLFVASSASSCLLALCRLFGR